MATKLSLQSLPDADVFSPCSIEHQDVFMYDDERRSELESDNPTYLDMSSNKSVQFPGITSEPEIDTLMSWTQKHPENWTQHEILDWIYFVAGTIDVDHTTIRGEGFQNITGPELCRMTLEDFQKRDPVNGKYFYDMFKSLLKDAFFSKPSAGDFTPMDQQQYSFAKPQIKSEFKDTTSCSQPPSIQLEQTRPFDSIAVNESEMQVKLGEFWYTIDCQELDDVLTPQYWPSDIGYSSSDSESVSDISDRDSPAPATIYNDYHNSHRHGQRNNSLGSDVLSDDDYNMSVVPSAVESHHHKAMTQKRKPASQRKKHASGGSGGDWDRQQNRGRKPGQLSKGNHLWEFIRDLLKDAKFNPHLLRWEEKATGVFRFVQSEAVAQEWGRKKNNKGMTYEKLSRAMRYYYKRGILNCRRRATTGLQVRSQLARLEVDLDLLHPPSAGHPRN